MIFLNKGEDINEHEIISQEEYIKRYGETWLCAPRPHKEEGRRLRQWRVERRVTMRELGETISNIIGDPFGIIEVCDVESGKKWRDDAPSLWVKALFGENPELLNPQTNGETT
jgi:hypothetical protein